MNNQSDHGYSSDAVSMRCIACGSMKLNCCDGNGGPYTPTLRDRVRELFELSPPTLNANNYGAGSAQAMAFGQGCNSGWDAAITRVINLIDNS